MPTLRGSLDSSHCPTIAIAVSAPSRPSEFFDALIDTGFTGFVQLPARQARKLGLTPLAASEIEYADGRIATIPLSWATVALGVEAQAAFIHLQRGSNEVIVGVEFLRVFQKTFVLSITPGLVLLVDSLVGCQRRIESADPNLRFRIDPLKAGVRIREERREPGRPRSGNAPSTIVREAVIARAAAVTVDRESRTLGWPNGADFDPGILHGQIMKLDARTCTTLGRRQARRES